MKKKCFKCLKKKDINKFYRHPKMKDGHLSKCIECTKKDVNKNRAENIDYYRGYDRERGGLPHRKKAVKEYQHTERGKEASNRAKRKWSENNSIKKSAAIIVNNAVRDCIIIKPKTCSECGKGRRRIHGHHDDYRKPLEVRWLCSACHSAWHKENGEAKGAG